MNRNRTGLLFVVLALVVALSLVFSGSVQAAGLAKTVIANTFTLETGETLDEDLTILAGTVVLEKGSAVNGDVVLTGGTLEVAGTVDGDITATGGTLSLKKSAQVTGDIQLTGVAYNQADGAVVEGSVERMDGTLPAIPGVPKASVSGPFSLIWDGIWFLARVFVMSALAILVTMFFPRHVQRTAQAIVAQPLTTGGLGLLTAVVAPFVVVLLSITLILIPVALLGLLALGLVSLFGWIALGQETGSRLAKAFNQEWAPPLSAGLGTLLLTFVLFSINFIPCVGWVFPFAAGMLGLGAAILTAVGTRDYPDTTPVYRPPAEPAVVDATFTPEPPPDNPLL